MKAPSLMGFGTALSGKGALAGTIVRDCSFDCFSWITFRQAAPQREAQPCGDSRQKTAFRVLKRAVITITYSEVKRVAELVTSFDAMDFPPLLAGAKENACQANHAFRLGHDPHTAAPGMERLPCRQGWLRRRGRKPAGPLKKAPGGVEMPGGTGVFFAENLSTLCR